MWSTINATKSMSRLMVGLGLVLTTGFALSSEDLRPHFQAGAIGEQETLEHGSAQVSTAPYPAIQAGRLTYNLGTVCSAITPPTWRDSIVVPDGWTTTSCAQWAESISAAQYQLGYVTATGYTWCTNTCW